MRKFAIAALAAGTLSVAAGAILVAKHNDGSCSYRYNGQIYRDRCR